MPNSSPQKFPSLYLPKKPRLCINNIKIIKMLKMKNINFDI